MSAEFEDRIPETLGIRELMEYQRRLAASHDLTERFKTLWISAILGDRLSHCRDRHIGQLLSLVQDGLGIFTPEYAIAEHSKRRLLRSTAGGE